VIFLHKGEKLWEGSNETILQPKVAELKEFIFANKLLREMRD
jgi:phospholipid/cholesterol/gamma-HCH transport system ATP-binding protein